jgi:hypothetical protein
MAGFMDRVRRLRDEASALCIEAEAFYEGGPTRNPAVRRRGRPAGSGARSAAAGGEPAADKITLAQLPQAIAQRYPQIGASEAEIRQMLGWKATAPIGNVERLVKQGLLSKTGDRYMPPSAGAPQERAA